MKCPICGDRLYGGVFLCDACGERADYALGWWLTYGRKVDGLPKPLNSIRSDAGALTLIYGGADYLNHRACILRYQYSAVRERNGTYTVIIRSDIDHLQLEALLTGTTELSDQYPPF